MNTLQPNTNVARLRAALATLGLAVLLASGCAPFRAATPDGMVELDEPDWSVYSYRATSPEGVVIAARQIRMRDHGDVRPADLDFWLEATKLRLRTTAGYALLSEEPTQSADGTDGVRLSFGRDSGGTPYRYDVALFVTDKFVHVIEAGASQELFEAESDAIGEAFAGYRIRR